MHVGNPFKALNGEVCAGKSGVYQSDQEWSYFDSLYFLRTVEDCSEPQNNPYIQRSFVF